MNQLQMPRFAQLEHDLKTDVLIIGGGLAGILCAHRLAQDDVNYALIEADRICHGVTRNTTAKITSKELKEEMAALERLGILGQFVTKLSLSMATAGAIRFRNQAQFNPLKLISGIAKGLNIYEKTAAKSFQGNTVQTDRGKITASKIIVTTHFPILKKHSSYFLKLYQQRSYVLALDPGPQLEGMYLDAAGDTGPERRAAG